MLPRRSLAVALLCLAACGSGASGPAPLHAQGADSPALTDASVTTTPALTVPPVTDVPAPIFEEPEPLLLPPHLADALAGLERRPIRPPDEHLIADVVPLGEIAIPKIGLVHPIFEGITLNVLDYGPGHWPGTALPGQPGNAVFAGHRVTRSHPFREVDRLAPGDEIVIRTSSGEFRYQVTKQEIVLPNDTWIAEPTAEATLTLFACHPPHSKRQRMVIRATLVAPAAS